MSVFTWFSRMSADAKVDVLAAEKAVAKLGSFSGLEKTVVQSVLLLAQGNYLGAEALFASALTAHQTATAAPMQASVASASPAPAAAK